MINVCSLGVIIFSNFGSCWDGSVSVVLPGALRSSSHLRHVG